MTKRSLVLIVCALLLSALPSFTLAQELEDEDTVSLSRCTTIDSALMAESRAKLFKLMADSDGYYGQMAIVDSKTGHLMAWVALRKSGGEIVDAPLLKDCCTARVVIQPVLASYLPVVGLSLTDTIDTGNGVYTTPDGVEIKDWVKIGKVPLFEAIKARSNIAIYNIVAMKLSGLSALSQWKSFATMDAKTLNAMELAAILNSFCNMNTAYIPTLEGDSLLSPNMDEMDPIVPKSNESAREYMTEVGNHLELVTDRFDDIEIAFAGFKDGYSYALFVDRKKAISYDED